MMRRQLLFLLGLFCLVGYGQEQRELRGRVSDGAQPIADVSIRVAGSDTGTFTDENGAYSIAVQARDTVVFSSMGFKTYRFLVEDISRFHNPILLPEIVELDEVVVQNSRRKSQKEMLQEYPYNKNLLQTAFGLIDGETAAGQFRVIPGDQILPIGICILDYMRSRFPGIRVVGDCIRGGNIQIRGGASSITQTVSPIWDVDGMIFREAPIWLPLENIERMAIAYSLAFVAKYGQGSGVIIINTKSYTPKKTKDFDMARLRDNYQKEALPDTDALLSDAPNYYKYLRFSPDLTTARSRFDSLQTKYKGSPYFVLDAYTVFYEGFGDEAFADAIIESHKHLFEANPVHTKALAYLYESQGRLDKAEQAYEQVFWNRPRYAQSYFDMARIKREQKQPRRALALLKQYNHLLDEGKLLRDTTRIEPFLERELNNLLTQNKRDLVSAEAFSDLYVDPDDEARGMTRIVVEWNHADADFELQFVNPGDQYFTWKHSVFEDAEAIMNEKIHGFNSKEFILDKSLPGQWRINVKYLGNRALTPTYLKITTYEDYGTPRQSHEVRVFKLQLKNLNYELLTLNNPALVAAK